LCQYDLGCFFGGLILKFDYEKLNIWYSPDRRENPTLFWVDWNDSGRIAVLKNYFSAPEFSDEAVYNT
jgi:hypothetical protein